MPNYISTELDGIRRQFPALARRTAAGPAVFLDGPAGTQVPQRVIQAISDYLVNCNANHGGLFPTSVESDRLLEQAHRTFADFVGASDPDEIVFGANMTTLTFHISRALSRTWHAGDEIVVTRLDHDANVTPWVLAAQERGVTVRYVDILPGDCTLNLDDLQQKLTSKTRLVAVGCASNSVGTLNPVGQITAWAREAGALVYLDAVHYAPHQLIDVAEWNCDFLVCSAYKFFGPHLGIAWSRRSIWEELPAYKVRPAPNSLPGKWMTGTQNHEGIAGAAAAVDYLAELGRASAQRIDLQRRSALRQAFATIAEYERELAVQLLDELETIAEIRVYGITDRERMSDRVCTFSIVHDRVATPHLAAYLAEQGFFAWHGNYYAVQLSETLGLEPQGMVRLGPVHYNSPAEIERLGDCLRRA